MGTHVRCTELGSSRNLAMIGYDISRYQTPGTVPKADFWIIQAGRNNDTDPYWRDHLWWARQLGVPNISFYYRVFPYWSAEEQADKLVAVARESGLSRRTLWVDIENPSSSEPWPGDAGAYEDRFVARANFGGWECGAYSGDFFWRNRGLHGYQGKWKAAYSYIPAQPWDIHQFTSTPRDTNSATDEAVARLFGSGAPARKANTGVQGMLLESTWGSVYLVGPGHMHHVPTPDEVNRLKYIGVPYVVLTDPDDVVRWGTTFGAQADMANPEMW